MLKIRSTLIGLFGLLGFGFCVLVSIQFWENYNHYREASDLAISNLALEQIARTGMAVADERTEAYLSLLRAPTAEKTTEQLRDVTNAVFREAGDTLARVGAEDRDTDLRRLQETLTNLRDRVDQEQPAASAHIRAVSASEVLAGYSQLADDLISLRSAIRSQEQPGDVGTATAFQMRRYSSMLIDYLTINQALIGGLLIEQSSEAEQSTWDQIRSNAERAEMAFEILEDRAVFPNRMVRIKLAALDVAYRDRYCPLENVLLRDLANSAAVGNQIQPEVYGLVWSTRQITRMGADLQEDLFSYSRDLLAQQQRQASLRALVWLSILLLGLGVVALGAWIVIRRVIQPLDRLRHSMLALANRDLKAPLPNHSRPDEVGAMADALRVFKASVIRETRLREERHVLHEKLHEAYYQLQKDLEAASVVQLSLLPEPAHLDGISFCGQLRPSHFISGDTYDVVQQPNGTVQFFLADVAGHGAAAALVSVATHNAVSRLISQRHAGDSLSGLLETLNDGWPEHLPYFTMLMGELRPKDGRGIVVQAGHPPPVLLKASGLVELIGQGGLPIGVLRGATFDEISFDFEPGDRLLVYSDGLSEAEDPSGQPFTEERLLNLLRSHPGLSNDALLEVITQAVKDWSGSERMEDDMTMLVIDAVFADEAEWPLAA